MAEQPPPSADEAPDREIRGLSFVLAPETGRDGVVRLGLRAAALPAFGAICADWLAADVLRRINAGRRQPLGRALGLARHDPASAGPLRVVDATAGLGRDGFVLAALGASVMMIERQPLTCALLRDAQDRAANAADARLAEAAGRVTIIEADAAGWLAALAAGKADAVFLDPMYPDDGKTALPGKEMQLLRKLSGGDADADTLLRAALAAPVRRAVVKRPAKAPPLAGLAPTHTIDGTQLRFDVYVNAIAG